MGTIVVDPDIKVWGLKEYLDHISPALEAARQWHAAAHAVATTGTLDTIDNFHDQSKLLLEALNEVWGNPSAEEEPKPCVPVECPPTQTITVTQATYVVQRWEESEAGWGVRPDGWSLHASQTDLRDYVTAYWARMPSSAPAEYERPSGSAYLVDADKLTWDEISAVSKSTNGVRFYERNYPDGR